ncbi:hypothetical protein [Pseudomonas sp. RC10]|uniref:hypothetical protein n=1 Tax=Pseudomonas bambusae TaxID=3139142 RepID=UPI003138E146
MEFEIVVEGFVLDVEVTHCINQPACPHTWDSDRDFYGEREIEFRVCSAITYDRNGKRQRVSCQHPEIDALTAQIETALWFEIDSRNRRARWAA